jgi:hypothetical protein
MARDEETEVARVCAAIAAGVDAETRERNVAMFRRARQNGFIFRDHVFILSELGLMVDSPRYETALPAAAEGFWWFKVGPREFGQRRAVETPNFAGLDGRVAGIN